jgi:hypothetical protein
MKKIVSILFAVVLVVSLGLVTAAPVLAGTTIHVPDDYATIQEAIDAAGPGDTIMVAAGEYDAFLVDTRANISIIGAEGATVTTANLRVSVDVGPVEDAWVMATVLESENINIEGIDFDGTDVSGDDVVGIAYVDSTGRIADLTVENIIGTELEASVGVAIMGYVATSMVDLSDVTVQNSMAGVVILNAEANLDGCTIRGMPQGIVIGWPSLGFDPSTVNIQGSTIADNYGIGIWVCDDSILAAHFNNIVGNGLGVQNDGGETVDATYNWWGHISGPRHLTTNPSGTGNLVIGDVDFEPWLGAETVTQKIIDGGTVNAMQQADTTVLVTGTATVTVSKPTVNPGGDPPAGTTPLGRYIDVYVSDATEVEEIEIRHYYTDDDVGNISKTVQQYLRLRWWDGTEWRSYSDGGVNTDSTGDYAGYTWGRVRANTEPRLTDLTGRFNGDFIEGPKIPVCFSTAVALGTNAAQKLNILREFRDEVMLPNALGATFVSFYYTSSPPIASFISRHDVLTRLARLGFLDPIVKILNWSHDLWSARGP